MFVSGCDTSGVLCFSGGHHETSVFIDDAEFWFVKEPQLTYEEAYLFCSMNDSKLAEPQSFTALRQVHKYLTDVSEHVMITIDLHKGSIERQ